ncbi:ubiquitin carboxyl-terminal hydrolase [Xylariaceae sp. FL0804]|nr:ubiquitin carboxyl-terminal hydrolase [Xylariaceae sp. FL0804]
MDTLSNNGNISPVSGGTPVAGSRRSTRNRKAPAMYDGASVDVVDAADTVDTVDVKGPPRIVIKEDSRPKRKAAQLASQTFETGEAEPQDVSLLLNQSFAQMDANERKEYQGWVELESEPGFFNAMLHELGAKDLKIQEVLGIDEVTLAELRKPVHGLIFLYQWNGEDESDEGREPCPQNLWFGNQTTTNACATVALMNIIMNAQDAKLGPELLEFKSLTKSLSPPHRGHALDRNDFIRGIHNSVARRLDLLSEDLLLDNKFDAAQKRKSGKGKKSQQKNPSKRHKMEQEAYHYIAYVPVDGQVWELDGFDKHPRCVGPHAPDDPWLSVASRAVSARMATVGFLSFNLLAVCQSPLVRLGAELAARVARLHRLHARFAGDPRWDDLPAPALTFTDERLAALRRGGFILPLDSLCSQAAAAAAANDDLVVKDPNDDDYYSLKRDLAAADELIRAKDDEMEVAAASAAAAAANAHDHPLNGSNSNSTNSDNSHHDSSSSSITPAAQSASRDRDLLAAARPLAQQLHAGAEAVEARCAAELAAQAEAVAALRRRQRDYTPAVHAWVRLLAEKGVLRGMIRELAAAAADA